MSLSFWAWPYLGFADLSGSFSHVKIIYMIFLIPGLRDPFRLLGGREPIISWKLQKIGAILSALFLGRRIKGALEPEQRYHSGPWLKVNLTVVSLLSSVCGLVSAAQGKWLGPCCGESSMAMASALPSLTWSEAHTELSKPWDTSGDRSAHLPAGESPDSVAQSMSRSWAPPNSMI